jgi:hypothetical protein
MNKLTEDDFILKEYAWTKISKYALTEDNILLKYEGDKTGFPIYQCLYKGWWEVTDACGIAYESISKSRPISEEEAKTIISKEEKPISARPPERNNWIS